MVLRVRTWVLFVMLQSVFVMMPASDSQAQQVGSSVLDGQQELTSDREVLSVFYETTDGSEWKQNSNWLTKAPLEEWFGVTTDSSGRVIGLELQANGLSGVLPPQLGALTRLQRLNLSGNWITRVIPREIGNLTQLRYLNLENNELTGASP